MLKLTMAGALACLLSGCVSAGSLNATLDTLARNYAHCERTVTYMATMGPINPASGAQISGTVHCPPVSVAPPTASPIPPPL